MQIGKPHFWWGVLIHEVRAQQLHLIEDDRLVHVDGIGRASWGAA